jgi:hypothetical protein
MEFCNRAGALFCRKKPGPPSGLQALRSDPQGSGLRAGGGAGSRGEIKAAPSGSGSLFRPVTLQLSQLFLTLGRLLSYIQASNNQTFRNFNILLIIYRLYDLSNLPRKWNNGMLACWNIGSQKDIRHFNFIVNPVNGGTINPTLHYPLRGAGSASRRPEPIIPLFQDSIILPLEAGRVKRTNF